MFTIQFWADAAERAVATAAQAGISVLTVGVTGLLDIDVASTLSVTGLAALLSVLKSLAARTVGDGESASLAPVDTVGKHAEDRVRS